MIPGNEPFLVLLRWGIVILHSVFALQDHTGTLDSAPEMVFRKRGSPSNVSTRSLQASSHHAHFGIQTSHIFPLTQVCVNNRPYGLSSFNSLTVIPSDIQRSVYCSLYPPFLGWRPFSVVHSKDYNPHSLCPLVNA
jgi:hypothetical protein